ncbi:MAG: MFS transporter [Actinomycetes bacterium]
MADQPSKPSPSGRPSTQTIDQAGIGSDPATLRRVGIASFIGALVEWYDFFLYGLASALIFGPLFFPGDSPLISTLSSFATFAVGFFARPIGGVIFGHVGDRVGRKSALVATLVLMGTATFAIGLLPTADTLGWWAALLLVLLRVLQGVAVGGEWGGAVLMMTEHAPARRRGLYGSWPQTASSAALLLANGLLGGLSWWLGDAAFEAWGWRIPFLISALLVVVGLVIRLRIPESPQFERVRDAAERSERPVVEALTTQQKSVALVIGLRVAENACGYLISVFALSYVTGDLGLASSLGLLANMAAAAVQFCLTPLYGALTDRVGRRPVYLFGAGLHAVFAVPFFLLLQTENVVAIVVAFVIAYAVANGALFATQPSLFSELFGTSVRYSGISLGYQFSAIFAGGLAPFIATALLAAGGGEPWLVAGYWVLLAVITFGTTLVTPETRPVLPASTSAEARAAAAGRE